jgi:hypothetical protein
MSSSPAGEKADFGLSTEYSCINVVRTSAIDSEDSNIQAQDESKLGGASKA